MLKEIAILLAAFGCMCIAFFAKILMPPQYFTPSIAYLPLAGFMGLMTYGGFQIKNLYRRSPKGAMVFLAIWLTLILIPIAYIIWEWTRPSIL
jgi:fluoride ion exporter CrcB/FEX